MELEEKVFYTEELCRCKCCLSYDDLKSLWEIHENDGVDQAYGQMAVECFALLWYPSDAPEHICESCIIKLREAFTFKMNILAIEEVMNAATQTKEETEEDEEDPEDEKTVDTKYAPTEEDYQNIEYLEVEESQDDNSQTKSLTEFDYMSSGRSTPGASTVGTSTVAPSTMGTSTMGASTMGASTMGTSSIGNSQERPPSPQRKWPKKKRKRELTRLYKQYTQEDLRQAIQAVRSGKMTCAMSSVTFGIPKKTLTVKVNTYEEKNYDSCQTENANDKHHKLVEEIKMLLTHTTAMPFKTKTTRYYCFYCSTDGKHFEDADELREHTRKKHAHEWTKIEMYMRPQWLNEIIKLDVEDLHCKICLTMLTDWNNLFVHMGVMHDLEFDMAYSRIIPYALNSDLKCFLCHQGFHNFGHLDSHMNNHYHNYICYECGDTFLSVSRLEKHLKVHQVGNYPCEFCEKVFKLEKYRAKHISLVHIQESTIKCLYCTEKFVGNFQRHLHVTEHHKEKVKYMTCEYCGKSYTWKPYFLAHMRRKHGAEKRHKCKHCDKCFLMKYELKNHMVRHTGEKNFICGFCGLGFTRMVTLKKHCQNDHQDGSSV